MLTHLVGSNFRPAECREIVKTLEEGTVLVLERDPQNQYDSNAIKVMYDAGTGDSGPVMMHLGFIPKSDNADLANEMDHGKEFACSMQDRISYRDITLLIEPA